MGEKDQGRIAETARVTRGARRWLASLGAETLTEFYLDKRMRVDLLALAKDGEIWILEVKSCAADYRSDTKWPGYLDWCDRFFFCVGREFPRDLPPDEVGLVVADAFGGALARDAPKRPLAAARRKALTLRAARDAAARLRRLADPDGSAET